MALRALVLFYVSPDWQLKPMEKRGKAPEKLSVYGDHHVRGLDHGISLSTELEVESLGRGGVMEETMRSQAGVSIVTSVDTGPSLMASETVTNEKTVSQK